MKTFVFASDLHGDHQNSDAAEAVLRFCKTFQPDVRIFGGDLFDFTAIRRGASAKEKKVSMEMDVYAGIEFLNRFSPHMFLRGNHDERIWDLARFHELGLMQDIGSQAVKSITATCKKLRCKMLPYDSFKGVYELGNLRFIHGYHAGVYAAKKHAEVYAPPGGAVLFGHVHSIQASSMARHGGSHGYAVGCLANLNPEYNRHQTGKLMHEHGFAYGFVDKKHWQVFQAKPNKEGKWVVAKELMTL